MKDSNSWLDHINGKKHNRALGMNMRYPLFLPTQQPNLPALLLAATLSAAARHLPLLYAGLAVGRYSII